MDLTLKKLSVHFGQATGNEIIIATANYVQKDDIEVYFVHKDSGWRKQAKIDEDGVQANNTIHFYSPPYMDADITSDVIVHVELLRPSDRTRSNPLPFTFSPSLSNKKVPIGKAMNMHSSLKDMRLKSCVESIVENQKTKNEYVISEERVSDCTVSSKPSKRCLRFEDSDECNREIRSFVGHGDYASCFNAAKFPKIQHDSGFHSLLHQEHVPKSDTVRSTKNSSEDNVEFDFLMPSSQESFVKYCVSEKSSQDSYESQESSSSGYFSEYGLGEALLDQRVEQDFPCISPVRTVKSQKNIRCVSLLNKCKEKLNLSSIEGETKIISTKNSSSMDHQQKVNLSNIPSMESIENNSDIMQNNSSLDQQLNIPLGAKRIISRFEVDSSGACLKIPRTGVQLIIPPHAIPNGETIYVGLALDWDYSNIPGKDDNDGCIAPIITCLPNRYSFETPVLLVFPHSLKDGFKEMDLPVKLFTSSTDPDEEKDWKQVEYNQNNDASSPLLFLENQYAYLFVNHFTDHTIVLGGKEYAARYIRIAIYASPIEDCEESQEVRIYCHGERDDLKKLVEDGEKELGGRLKTFKAKVEIVNCSDTILKVSCRYDLGWTMKSSHNEQLLGGLWRKGYGSCQYTFGNNGQSKEFYCQIEVQQLYCDEVNRLEFKNRVKNSARNDTENNCPMQPYVPPPVVPDSGHGSFCSHEYHQSVVATSKSNVQYAMLRQMSCPSTANPAMLCQLDQVILAPDMTLPYVLRLEISLKLDPEILSGNDWRMFADNLGVDRIIGKLERSQNPTNELLNIWVSKNETLNQLVERFNAIKRSDVAKLVKDHITHMNSKSPSCLPTNQPVFAALQEVPEKEHQNVQNTSDDLVKMSTSSSASSLATPDVEFDQPNLLRSSSVFDNDNYIRVKEMVKSMEDITVDDNENT